jgi:hypothetical protein
MFNFLTTEKAEQINPNIPFFLLFISPKIPSKQTEQKLKINNDPTSNYTR